MVGIISDRTKNIDRTLRNLASDFRRSNIKSVRAGESQPNERAEEAKKKIEKEGAPGSGVIWADPKNKSAKLGRHEIKVGTPKSVAGESVGFSTQGFGRGPRVGSYIADHENLKIQK